MSGSEHEASGKPSQPRADRPSATLSDDDDWAGTTGKPEPTVRSPGSHVAGYIVLHQLGAGGMGIVYAAYDPNLDRKIALKVLRTAFGDESEPVARARLLGEGRALARLNHRNVVTVYDVGAVGDEVYVAMELIDGHTLKQWREQESRTWRQTVALFIEIGAGLSAVHQAGLVHRDVKPDNVLIDHEGHARVTDFGLARAHVDAPAALEASERDLIQGPLASGALDLTQTGARLGTPAYMSSEQLQGDAATAKSDQFAYCVALWECLYGIRPFEGHSWMSLMLAINEGDFREHPPNTTARPVPTWLRRIVERGLAPNPELRWPSIQALSEALAQGDPGRKRRRIFAGLALGLVAFGGTAGVYANAAAQKQNAIAACAQQSAVLDGLWTEQAREGLVAQFLASEVQDAKALADGIVTTLDEFATTWAHDRNEACIAGSVEHVLTPEVAQLRIACLEDRRSMFAMLVQEFSVADDIAVKRAQRSTDGVADLASCRDDDRLESRPAPPSDPKIREQVRVLFAELAATKVHEHLGHYDEGQALADAALTRAMRTGHRPLIATARYRVAVFFEKRGKYDEAVDAWVGSFRDASLGGSDQLAAEAASALAFTEGYQLARHDAGIRWAQLAGIYTERLGITHTLTEATRLDVLAVMYDMKKDYATSIETHHLALALRRELQPPQHHSIGYGLANLASVLRSDGQVEPAKAALLQAKNIFEAAFGPENPTTAHVLHSLGNLYIEELGEYAAGEELLDRVEAIWTKSLGATHPDVGDLSNAFGEMRRKQGRFDEAAKRHQRALAIHQKSQKEGHPDIAKSATTLAQVQLLQANPDAAEANFRLALETLRHSNHPQRDSLGRAHHGLARIALGRGKAERARDLFEQARSDFEADGDDHASWIARCRIGVAATYIVAAEAAGERAQALMLNDVLADDTLSASVRAEALAWRARLLQTQGDAEAAELARAEATSLLAEQTPDIRARANPILTAGTAYPTRPAG